MLTVFLTTKSVDISTYYDSFTLRLKPHFYRPQRSCKGYVFTGVCPHGGVCLSACWDTIPPGADPPRADTPQSRHPRSRHPPRADTPPERRPLLRTERILLECILVIKRTYLFCLIELFMNLNDHIFYTYHKIKNSIFTCNYMLNIARVVRTSVRTASLKI